MMKRIHTLTTIAMLLLSTTLVAPLTAAPGPLDGRRDGGPRARQALRAAMTRIGLSDEQRSRIHDIRAAHAQTIVALRAQERASAAQLQALLAAAHPDPTAIGTAMLDTRSNRKALRSAQEAAKDEVLAVLSAEQRGELKAYLDVARARAANRHRRPVR